MITFNLPYPTVQALLYFAAKKDIRHYLKGVNVEILNTSTARVCASNGHILASYNLPLASCPKNVDLLIKSCIIPISVLQSMKHKSDIIVKIDTEFEVGNSAKVKRVTLGLNVSDKYPIQVSFLSMDGTYPDIDRVIPSKPTGEGGYFDMAYVAGIKKAVPGVVITPSGDGAALLTVPEDSSFIGVLMPLREETNNAVFIGPTNKKEAA